MTSGDAYPSTLSAGYRAPASFLPPPPSSYASPSALRPSTAQNIPKSAQNIPKSFGLSGSAVASLGSFGGYRSDSRTLAQNQARRVEKVLTPVELSWQSVWVGHPVDARQLREEAMLASATPAATRIPESLAVPSAFLPQKTVPSVSNRGLDSLLNHHPSASPPSTPGSTSLPPMAQLSPLQLPPAHPPLSRPSNPTPPARAGMGALLLRPSSNPVPPGLTPTSTLPVPALPGNDCMVTASSSLQRAEVDSASRDTEGDGTTALVPSPAIQSPGWVVRQGPNRAASGSIPAVPPIMGPGERQLKARTKDTAFPEAVKALADHTDGEIRRIAAEFKKSLLTVKKVMGVHRRFRERRSASLYNAVMHKKAQELRLEGRRLGASLGERHKAIADDEEIQEILNDPDGDDAQDVLRELKEYQLAKFQGSRASAKANDNDIVKTWGAITHNAQNLSKRTSAATFGFVCSSKPGQNVSRQFFGNGPIEGFLTSKFGMTGSEFVEAAEAYFILTSSGRTATGTSIKKMQKEITRVLLEGLRDITGNPNLSMEWEHYEALIVKPWGIKLEGWPEGVKMVTATTLHAADVISVYRVVQSRECKWRKLDGRELYHAKKDIDLRIKNGELAVPERQRRRGKKRAAGNEPESSGSRKKARAGQRINKGLEKMGKGGGGRQRQVVESESDGDDADALGAGEDNEGRDRAVEKGEQMERPQPKPLPRVIKRAVALSDDDESEEGGGSGIDLPRVEFIDEFAHDMFLPEDFDLEEDELYEY
ncbi:hypothetical protein DFH05DRAFT_1464208 [Lentinula detonsa]|uniref:Uncharacterized protein n=1 Tax=Lentinula detonsa TaxID=2804962 RepID=A0A9W8NQZ3_9AGAR|nr:hypothetical protein DFH05DRAFT_1464208 [Lentinula detonsa]